MDLTKTLSVQRLHWVLFTLALLITLSMFTLYGTNMIRWRNSPDFGWRTMYDSGPNVVANIFERGEEAGLRIGDQILAINGRTYSTFDDLFFEIRDDEPGSINVYAVARDGETLEFSVITGRIGLTTVLRRSGVLFLGGLVYFLIGVLIFLMKPRAKESWLFLIMTCLIGSRVSWAAPSDLFYPLWLFDIRNLFNVILPAPMIHLALTFPKTRTFLLKRPWLSTIPYLCSFMLFFLMEITSTAYWNIPPVLTLIFNIYMMLAVLIFLVSNIWNFLRDPSVLIRLQSQVIFIGIIIGFFIPAADLLMRSFWHVYLFPDPVIGFAVFLTAFPLSIGFTIVKYDLFAIDAVIKRTYGYLLTTGAIVGIYAVVVSISNLAFGRFEVTKSPAFPVIFVLAVVFFFNPVRNRVQKFIDRVFYRLEYDYQETVQKISETMRSLLKLDEIGKSMMDTALGAMFIDSGSVILLDKEKNGYECLIRSGEEEKIKDFRKLTEIEDESIPEKHIKVPSLNLPADESLIQKIAERKKEVTIYDIQKDPFFEADRASCEKAFAQLGATLIVPLIYEDKLTGLISLGDKKSGKFYRREDINLLNTLANQGAVAIENAQMVEEVIEKERMEEELNIARDLQVSMLPSDCPQIKGFEIAAYSVSAREVGGDFYDFIEMGTDRVGMVIGDVTGKSVSGALVMSSSRSVFRMLSEEEISVGEIMIRANRRIKQDIKTGMFVALLYAVLNAQDKTLAMCSAGQTQPIHFSSKTGKAMLVQTEGDTFPLGILEDSQYQETKIQLTAGDKIVFYTDGIVEAMNPQEEIFGFERLLEVVKEARALNADSLLKEVIDKVNIFAGGAAQHDDLTVIAVSVEE